MPTEQDVVVGPGVGEHPAHDVDTHPFGGLVELDGVAPALVHGPAVFAVDEGVTEDRQEWRLATKDGAHREHRIEPVPELAGEALGNEVRREPLLPVVRLLAVMERRERHDARVEPWIADVADPLDRRPAPRARDLDRVDPRPVRRVALELLPALDRPLVQLVAAADDIDRSTSRA